MKSFRCLLFLDSPSGPRREPECVGIAAALTQDTAGYDTDTDTFSRSLADLALGGAPSMAAAPSLVRCIIKYGQTLRALTEYNEVGTET